MEKLFIYTSADTLDLYRRTGDLDRLLDDVYTEWFDCETFCLYKRDLSTGYEDIEKIDFKDLDLNLRSLYAKRILIHMFIIPCEKFNSNNINDVLYFIKININTNREYLRNLLKNILFEDFTSYDNKLKINSNKILEFIKETDINFYKELIMENKLKNY